MSQLLGLLLQPFLSRVEGEDIASAATIILNIIEDRVTRSRAEGAIKRAIAAALRGESDSDEAVHRHVSRARLFLVTGAVTDELDLEELRES
jgi:hypothetical protein